MSNYADDMNDWNDEPNSPFYEPHTDDESEVWATDEREEDEEMSKIMNYILSDDELQAELAMMTLETQWREDDEEDKREAEYYMELMENSYTAWNERFNDD
jgi:hypothetical protein